MECDFCNNQGNDLDGIYQDEEGNYILRVYAGWNDHWEEFDYGEIEIKFCPICGRRL